MNVELWQKYAACWSASDADRDSRLGPQVSQGVRYRDPNIEVHGLDGLSSYMANFQKALPGHRFEIQSVASHHGRSMARWRQVDGAGNPVSDGISFATHDGEGKFQDITGFFAAAPT